MSVPPPAPAPPSVDEWSSLRPLVTRRGCFCTAEFQPEEEDPIEVLQNNVSGQHTATEIYIERERNALASGREYTC